MAVDFVVEGAGCPSCRERVRDALSPLGVVRAIEIDEKEDFAAVSLELDPDSGQADVEAVLAGASVGSGHAYRVRFGSWDASA